MATTPPKPSKSLLFDSSISQGDDPFQKLVENLPDVVMRVDRDLHCLYVNAAVQHYTGLHPSAWIGKRCDQGNPCESMVHLQQTAVRTVFETGQEQTLGYTFSTPEGLRSYHTRIVPEFDRDGAITTVLTITRDVTDFNSVSTQFQQSGATLNTIFSSISDGILVLDQNGVVCFANPSAIHLLGCNLIDQMLGIPLGGVSELEIGTLDGHVKTVEMKVVETVWSGKPAYVGSIRDITARKAIEAQLSQYATKLKQSNQELERFAFIASHDLLEPLRTIRNFCSLLYVRYSDSLDAKGQDYLERIRNGTQRMQAMIQDLLSLCRITTEVKPFERVNLSDVVRTAITNLDAQIQSADGQIVLDDLPYIMGDGSQLCQLFQNLISNALKFRCEVPPIVRIYSLSRKVIEDIDEDRSVTVCVEDNGVGFDEQHCDCIFEAFTRLHDRGKYEGTGIGLALCKKIVEQHNGTIAARSRVGKGSMFAITFNKD